MQIHSQWFDLQIFIGETGQYLKTELRLRELLSSMASLNGIASFVDTFVVEISTGLIKGNAYTSPKQDNLYTFKKKHMLV